MKWEYRQKKMKKCEVRTVPFSVFIKNDISVFYYEGGRHGGSYYGFSSGATGKVKIIGEGYKPLPGDKATIITFE